MSHSVQQPWKNFSGRLKSPLPCSNAEHQELLEFESFGTMGPMPRGAFTDANLSCVSMDLMQNENLRDHNTNLYAGMKDTLIIRRGQEFKITLHFNQPITPNDKFQMEFYIGTNCCVTNGTKNIVSFDSTSSRSGKWTGQIIQKEGDICVVGITPSPSTIVGKHKMNLAIIGNRGVNRSPSIYLYILFNAWVPEDEVFMTDEADRQEYVMNEKGCMYQDDSGSGKLWLFGQFEQGVLDACIRILDDSQMPIKSRGNVFHVSRNGSSMINFQRNRGVLVGNWSKDFSNGKAPTLWIGSVQILLEYVSKGPVKYAQCWVFAGVFNTFLRCLGIPARVITNFNSAHDSNGNIVTDLIFTLNGTRLELNESLSKDSVWNYHCWNEAYMSRPDLPAAHNLGGWQVVDATPQETSDGYYRCGPCSVKAVKEGLLSHQYDSIFVFAEVNSKVNMHKIDPKTGKSEIFKVDTEYVGRKIITKSIGENNYDPVDITETYKYPKGSKEKQEIMQRLEQTYGTVSEMQDDGEEPNVEMTLERSVHPVRLGDAFQVTVVFQNRSQETRTIQAYMVGSVVYYTNIHTAKVNELDIEITLKPMETSRVQVDMLAEEYLPHMSFQSHVRFTVTATCMENSQHLMVMDTLHLESPEFVFSMNGPARMNRVTFVTVQFTNPFTFALHDVNMAMTGPRIMSHRKKTFSLIEPGATISWTESCTPTLSGENMLYAVLDCPKLGNVRGNWIISIQP
ncbi:coagulation factor XIII A chain [Esox lucius]|uniref:Coagulation factor XIII, A1 polypeptide a, tandem duplicate 1 n=1 Tax=Esox lucius TaxID=8010 RepID=A0A3P8ZI03_ESOLU|nr:coagulation factor XIII A chain [Esox lucius]